MFLSYLGCSGVSKNTKHTFYPIRHILNKYMIYSFDAKRWDIRCFPEPSQRPYVFKFISVVCLLVPKVSHTKYFYKEEKVCLSGFKNKLSRYLYPTIKSMHGNHETANICLWRLKWLTWNYRLAAVRIKPESRDGDSVKVAVLVPKNQAQAPPSEFLWCYDNITLFSAFPQRQHHYSYKAEICRVKSSAGRRTVAQNMMEAKRNTSRTFNIRVTVKLSAQ